MLRWQSGKNGKDDMKISIGMSDMEKRKKMRVRGSRPFSTWVSIGVSSLVFYVYIQTRRNAAITDMEYDMLFLMASQHSENTNREGERNNLVGYNNKHLEKTMEKKDVKLTQHLEQDKHTLNLSLFKNDPTTFSGTDIPETMLTWTPPVSSRLTRTVCATKEDRGSTRMISALFQGKPGWNFVVEDEQNVRACDNSLIRVLVDQKYHPDDIKRRQVQHHRTGQQITTALVGVFIDKSELMEVIQTAEANPTGKLTPASLHLLRSAVPQTKVFHSLESCQAFCVDKANDLSRWLWKKMLSNQGNGIHIVGDVEHCQEKCGEYDGQAQVQQWMPAMMLEDGRKFDVRSHLLVASTTNATNNHNSKDDSLSWAVFAGAEKVRICAESQNNPNPAPFPGLPVNASFNPFQHICNLALGKKHPNFVVGESAGGLSKAIPDSKIRSRILEKIDAMNLAVVDLLSSRLTGTVGMLNLFGVDYLVDEDENIWLLEVNSEPGFTGLTGVGSELYPNPWPDAIRVAWEVLSSTFEETGNNVGHDGKTLPRRLEEMPLEYMRFLRAD